jgi:hypothetical protein
VTGSLLRGAGKRPPSSAKGGWRNLARAARPLFSAPSNAVRLPRLVQLLTDPLAQGLEFGSDLSKTGIAAVPGVLKRLVTSLEQAAKPRVSVVHLRDFTASAGGETAESTLEQPLRVEHHPESGDEHRPAQTEDDQAPEDVVVVVLQVPAGLWPRRSHGHPRTDRHERGTHGGADERLRRGSSRDRRCSRSVHGDPGRRRGCARHPGRRRSRHVHVVAHDAHSAYPALPGGFVVCGCRGSFVRWACSPSGRISVSEPVLETGSRAVVTWLLPDDLPREREVGGD